MRFSYSPSGIQARFHSAWRSLQGRFWPSVSAILFAFAAQNLTFAQNNPAQAAPAPEKKILLRNETIRTAPKRAQIQPQAAAAHPVSGLFLIQLEDNPPSDAKEQLEALQAKLLRPVPQDAFVAQLNKANLQHIQQLPFVRWSGPYQPRHKTHEQVTELLQDNDDRHAEVSVLLSPAATLKETAILQRTFGHLRRYSKSSVGRILQGTISSRKLKQLLDSQAVLWVEPAANPRLFDAVAANIVAGEGQNQRPLIHELGFDGQGVVVAVADSGLHLGEGEEMHPDLAGRVDAFFAYGQLTDASDEHSHGTHVTGIIAGDGATGETDEGGYSYGLGLAPKAHIVAQRIFDGVGLYQAPESFAQLTSDAVRAGAVIGSNSWGDDTQGRYDITAMEFDALVRDADPETPGDQPYILEFSAGNAGPGERTVGTPAVAKNVIATGASQNNRFDFIIYAEGEDYMADFSSRGPCEDGRIKPDLVAPGTWIASLQSAAASQENAWLSISPNYQYQGGTSQAGPQVSAAAALFVQSYRLQNEGRTPSPALVKAALINSAYDMDNSIAVSQGGTGYVPNMEEGWGRVDLLQLLGGDRSFEFTDQNTLLQPGQTFEKKVFLVSANQPLRVTLTYTDVPGFPPAIPALVNDLDLKVIGPDGTVYRGNQFSQGNSVPFAGGSDSINNVEAVHISVPLPGEYVVRVHASKVAEDARKDTAESDQDFALVISGDLPFPGRSVLVLNRGAYTVPGEIGVKLLDFDLAGAPSASVSLQSTSQSTPVNLVLLPDGAQGVFTGAVQTASLPVQSNGRLHIAHGDRIEVSYQDLEPQETITVSARADLQGPVISEVTATNRFGKELILWKTDERASSKVFFGADQMNLTAQNLALTQNHEIVLTNLVQGVTYRFYVVSTDEAGNTSTNDNRGAFFSFVAEPAATVLLVNAYSYTENDFREDQQIPVTVYTDALDRTGVSYELWDVDQEGSPTAADLKPFRIVVWRVNDSFYENNNTITLGQQTAISQYLEGGGSFLLSSMEILTRLTDSPFRTNILQVAGFKAVASPFEECPDCDQDFGVPSIQGAALESLTTGVSVELDYSAYPIWEMEPVMPNIGPDLSDTFQPTTNAVPIFFEPGGRVTGIRYPKTGKDATGRVVFLAFPLDSIPLDGPAPNNRVAILRNVLNFLAPGVNGLGSISLDNTTYTAPAAATVEVADSDLIGRKSLQLTCRNLTLQSTAEVELLPTVTPGLFRGLLTLIRTNQTVKAGRLQARDGDIIRAEYLDLSGNTLVSATAMIDLGVPTISALVADPDYDSATVKWETDEPTDALVQFGESSFLGKTVYHPGPSTSHQLVLTSLVPDRIYFYQVVSRDEAGNTVVDNNNGKLYTFRTRKPLIPPWTDRLENGSEDWTVFSGEDSEAEWQLGTPNNVLATDAHSPVNAWGTNLDGFGRPGYVQTFLISPAIELTGGNIATLRFWHNYDFSADSIFEGGSLLLFTNSQTQPLTLARYADFTAGWESQEFDLTPHLGKVVQIVWSYELLDFLGEGSFPGWLVDDVEVTVGAVSRGTLQVSNSLAAAKFTISGPSPTSTRGKFYSNSAALAGDYLVTWEPVPYYLTPPPQTQSLEANRTIVFQGHYTFEDSNQNEISDAWEQEFFGQVSPSRQKNSDSDGDGFTDFSEFVAGTDPRDPAARLGLVQLLFLPDGRVAITWASVADKTYVVLNSTDGTVWTRSSGELVATSAQTTTVVTVTPGTHQFFKIEVVP